MNGRKKWALAVFVLVFFVQQANCQQLDYFIEQGIKNNPLLNDYRNQMNAGAIDSLLVAASNKPQVNSDTHILVVPTFNSFGYFYGGSNNSNYSSVVDATQYIFNRKTLANKYESVKIQQQGLQNTVKISTSDLKKAITAQYLAAFTDFHETENGKAYLELIHQQQSILKQLVEQGIYKQSDYLSLVVEMQTAEIDLFKQESQLIKDASLLRQLCGLSDTAKFTAEMPSIATAKPVDISNSPLFQQFKIDSLKINNERKSIELRYVPKISWYADAGLMNSDASLLYRSMGYSLGLNMNIPIYDGHQRSLENQKLAIRENTRTSYQSFFKSQYSELVKQYSNELLSTRKTLTMFKSQLSTTKDLISLFKIQLNHGNASITELITTMKTLLAINRNVNQLQVHEFELINELNYLMQQ